MRAVPAISAGCADFASYCAEAPVEDRLSNKVRAVL